MTVKRLRRARGVVLAEAGVVYSVAILLLLGTMIVGLGVFRSAQVAWLANEGARWAAVHGPSYQANAHASAPSSADVLTYLNTSPKKLLVDQTKLTATLTWNTSATPKTVTFRLDYRWVPKTFVTGKSTTYTFSSTSSQVILY